MKLSRILFVVVALVVTFAVLMPAGASQRCVYMEHFTNASCPPCAAVNPTLRAMMNSLTHDTMVAVAYHVSWPGADPMYSYNPTEATARVNYYNVTGVPHVRIDGTYGMTPSASNVNTVLRPYIRSRYSAASPCTMDFSVLAVGETGVQVVGTLIAEQDMLSPSLRLFAALIVDTIQYGSPPGSNGETLFPEVFRDLWPSTTGQAFTLNAGDTLNIDATLNRQASWNVDDLEVVVWAQDFTSKAVHQAGIARVSRNYGMITESASARQLIWPTNGGEVVYSIDLTNIGMLDDTYDVNLEGTFPEGWVHTVEAAGVPADPTHIQVALASEQTTTLTVRMNPSGHPGSLDFSVHVTTPSEPLISSTEDFRLMSGLDILLVDDDVGGNRETWYLDALAATGTNLLYGRWDMNMNSLDASYLDGVQLVIWFTGDGWQDGTTITAADQAMLESYLNQGGKLFLSGQGIGFDIRTDPFFSDYIHGIFRQPYPGHWDLTGVANDPIGHDLDLMITGGNGANNQSRQSSTSPDATGLATPVFDWVTPPPTGGYPALKVVAEAYRLLYFGFGFEAIDNEADRDTVMQRSLDWFFAPTAADDPHPALPAKFALGQNFPNPFNPETTIPYVLPERANVTLHVFNLLGREVATLSQGVQDAGTHAVRFSGADLSSGLYFYRLDAAAGANTASATRKFMLLK